VLWKSLNKMMSYFFFTLLVCGAREDQGKRKFRGSKGLITKAYFKERTSGGGLNIAVLDVLDNMQVCVPLSVFRKIDTESMHKGAVDYLSLSIRLWIKRSGVGLNVYSLIGTIMFSKRNLGNESPDQK